jgi:hypothetical protein
METDTLKLKLVEWIIKQDSATPLKAVDKLISGMEKESAGMAQVIGFRAHGTRVTLSDFISQLNDLSKNNSHLTLEELEHQSETW